MRSTVRDRTPLPETGFFTTILGWEPADFVKNPVSSVVVRLGAIGLRNYRFQHRIARSRS